MFLEPEADLKSCVAATDFAFWVHMRAGEYAKSCVAGTDFAPLLYM